MEHSELLEIKDRAWERFRKIPGVHAVGLGSKIVGGSRTSEHAIMVFVVRKKARADLAAGELIPSAFEGITTDVIEMGEPRLTALPPITPTVDDDVAGTGKLVTLLGVNEPFPPGYVVVLVVTVTPTGAPPSEFVSFQTATDSTLIEIAAELAKFPRHPGFTVTHPTDSQEITIAPETGHAVEVDCYVVTEDRANYTRAAGGYLRGGILLGGAAGGTLGCLATIAPASAASNRRVVAITNQHVVSSGSRDATKLTAVVKDSKEILIAAPDGVPEALVLVGFLKDGRENNFAAYPTRQTDSVADVAEGVATAINNAAVDGVKASAAGSLVTVTGADSPGRGMRTRTFGRMVAKPHVKVTAHLSVDKPSSMTVPFTHVVTFEGLPSDAPCGVYVNITPGGLTPTFSVFADPAGLTPEALAAEISTLINTLKPPTASGLVSATSLGKTLKIRRAQHVECVIEESTEVGHPTGVFSWPCSDLIGSVIDARLDVDAAVIELEPGMAYKPQIEDIGPVDGVLPAELLATGLPVQKRGCVSGLTSGELLSFGLTGVVGGQGSFSRFYKNVLVLQSTTRDPTLGTLRPFLLSGDSGSALVTAGPGPVKVVGLLFASGDDTRAFATPIEQVVNAFEALELSFALEPGQDPNVVRVVPEPLVARQALPATAGPTGLAESRRPVRSAGWSVLGNRVARAHDELTATGAGRLYAEVAQRHFREAVALVKTNRRVGTVWQRNGGPEITNAVLQMACDCDRRLPTEIHGKPLAECLRRMQRVITRYASPAFSNDLARYLPQIASWSGMTYRELLQSFQPARTP
jgi:hypothetical protein